MGKHYQKRDNFFKRILNPRGGNPNAELALEQALEEIDRLNKVVEEQSVEIARLDAAVLQGGKDRMAMQDKLDHETKGRKATQEALDKKTKDHEAMQEINIQHCREIANLKDEKIVLEAHARKLRNQIDEAGDNISKEIRFTLSDIIEYCKTCAEYKSIQAIREMLNILLRYIGKPCDFRQVDGLNDEIERRKNQKVVMNNAHFDGPMYDINSNAQVNIGG